VNNYTDIAAAEYLLETTGAFEHLRAGLLRSKRGRKSNDHTLYLLVLGLLLSIMNQGMATVAAAHSALIDRVPLRAQLRLRITWTSDGQDHYVGLRDLHRQARRLCDGLAYGETTTPDLTGEERDRRRAVLTGFSNRLMDGFVTLGTFDESTLALDASGIWSWGKGGRSRKGLPDDYVDGEDPAFVAALTARMAQGEDPASYEARQGVEDPFSPLDLDPGVAPPPRRRRRSRRRPGEPARSSKDRAGKRGDDGLGYSTSFDGDASWSGKTNKDGKREMYFGYQVHALVLAPKDRLATDPGADPALIRRVEVTTAIGDVVDVSLSMLDSLRGTKDLLVDLHYSYKAASRWLEALLARGINQHHSLRSDEQGFTSYERVKWAAGSPHCPATPDVLGTIPALPPAPTPQQTNDFVTRIEQRRHYALRIVNQPDTNRQVRAQCPALAGSVGCPLRAGTVPAALANGLPIVEHPPDAARDGEPLPAVCTQQTRRFTLPESIFKLCQPLYWGSAQWRKMMARRTYVECNFGLLKDPSKENVHRGMFQIVGLPWVNLVVTLAAASSNLRLIRNWHERTGLADANHALVRVATGPEPWDYLTAPETQAMRDLYLSNLEAVAEAGDPSLVDPEKFDADVCEHFAPLV